MTKRYCVDACRRLLTEGASHGHKDFRPYRLMPLDSGPQCLLKPSVVPDMSDATGKLTAHMGMVDE